jgi:hypothetical protein
MVNAAKPDANPFAMVVTSSADSIAMGLAARERPPVSQATFFGGPQAGARGGGVRLLLGSRFRTYKELRTGFRIVCP